MSLGLKRFAFDLRGRSPNLVPFNELLSFLNKLPNQEVVLIFEDDKETTILSFLDLLKSVNCPILLEFRDNRPLAFYQSLQRPFLWMFRPEADWQSIFESDFLRGIILPLKDKETFQAHPQLWTAIEAKNLEVFLHTEKTDEAGELMSQQGVNVSWELTSEVELGYRRVDQEKLKSLKIWRKLNESSAF